MKVFMILAVTSNGAIGLNGKLACKLNGELSDFKRKTMGYTLFVGKDTYLSFGGRYPPGRDMIVISSDPHLELDERPNGEKMLIARSIESAIALAEHLGNELMVCGGSRLYTEFLTKPELNLSRVYITRIHGEVEGDTFFNHNLEDYDFERTSAIAGIGKEDPANDFDFTFEVWETAA